MLRPEWLRSFPAENVMTGSIRPAQRVCNLRRAVLAMPIALAACMNRMNATTTQQSFVDAGPGVQLFYRVDGSGSRTVVVLHGGPGFSHDYLADDLLPLAEATGAANWVPSWRPR
jgi:hypothetical protein